MQYKTKIKTKIKDLNEKDRPREKLIKNGSEILTNSELLAILIGSGYKGKNVIELSKDLVTKYSTKKLQKIKFNELSKEKGIGPSAACKIIASFELGKRVYTNQEEDLPMIKEPKDIYKRFKYLAKFKKEYLMGVYLNSQNQILRQETISIGTLTENLMHPREVFEPALTYHAVAVVLIHNHPSGNLKPSTFDIESTKQIKKAGEIMGIQVLDHIIISKNGFTSMGELGY